MSEWSNLKAVLRQQDTALRRDAANAIVELERAITEKHQEIEDLREVLELFAVYASALLDLDDTDIVHTVRQQSINVFAFREAAEVMGKEKS